MVASAVVWTVVVSAPSARALDVRAGDILVADAASGELWRIDPSGGALALLLDGDAFSVLAVAVDAAGDVYVVSGDGLLHFSPGSDVPRRIAEWIELGFPYDVEVTADGGVVVAGLQGVLGVDPATGDFRTLIDASSIGGWGGIAVVDASGVYWADATRSRLDLWSPPDELSNVVEGDPLEEPSDVAIAEDGLVYLTDGQQDGVLRVDAANGHAEVLARLGLMDDPADLDIEADGRLVVADPGTGAVVRVDPETLAQSFVAPPGTFAMPSSIAVVPMPEPTALLGLLTVGAALLVRAREPAQS